MAYDSASPDAMPAYYLDGGILYAANRRSASSCDRLEIHFDSGKDEIIAWVDARNLYPLSDEESLAFAQARSASQGVRFCCGNPALPLDAVSYSAALSFSLYSMDAQDQVAAPAMLVSQTEMSIGLKETLPIGVSFSDGNSYAVTYTSENKKIASVNANGMVTGKTRGTTVIHVLSEFGNEIRVQVHVKKAPKAVKLSAPRKTLGVGETMMLSAKLDAGYASALTYTSSNPAVATVDANGCIQALAAGTSKITVSTYNGKKASGTLTVLNAPQAISFGADALTLGLDETRVLSVTLNEGSTGEIRFESNHPEILSIDSVTGEARAVALGEAVVTATAYNGVSMSIPVCVKAAPSGVSIAHNSLTIGVGEKIAMPEITLGAEGEDCAGGYTLKSSNKKYVAVSDGVIKGVRRGKAQITVTTYNGKTAKLSVNVYNAPSKLTLNTKSAILGVGESLQLSGALPKRTAGAVSYSSNNEAIAIVSPDGKITAVSTGTAVITARTFNGKTAACTVSVKDAPQSVALNRSSCSLGVGEIIQLSAILNEGSAGSCTFESLNPEIVSTNAAGKLRANAPGEAEVEVRTYNGKTARCSITVKSAPTAVSFQERSLTLCVGDSYQLQTPTLSGEDAACSTFVYKSSGTKYVKVNSSGLVTALRTGTKNITVSTYNGKKATIKVTVKAAPKSVAFGESAATLFIGMEYTPKLNFNNGLSGSYQLTSSNSGVAAISADGHSVIAVSAGTADITATTFNGKKAAMKLTVPALPSSIELRPSQLTLGAGDSCALNAVMPAGSGCKLEYSSNDAATVSVSEDGKVSALRPGAAAIDVHTTNGLTSTSHITVLEAPTRLQLTPRSAARSLNEGSLQLTASFGASGQGGRVSYASSDPAIATVSEGGCVSFRAAGTVRITAETYNGHRAVCDLTIGEQPGEMHFAAQNVRVALGDTVTIPVTFDKGCESFHYSISDPTVASVSGDQVTALSIGTATLTAISRSGLTASCTLSVAPAPTGITLTPASAEMILTMDDLQLTASAQPDGLGSVYYLSSDPAVADVDYVTGQVSARGVGECIITATTYDGLHSAQCTITVRNLLDGVKIGIDPGHQAKADYSREAISPNGGGRKAKVSSGTAGRTTRVAEYVVNLQIGLKLRDALESYGAEVYMTRETNDVNISNQQRAKMMNELGVDMVFRIHLNGSSRSSSINGMCSYVRKTGVYKKESAEISKLVLKHMSTQTGAKNLGVNYSDGYTGLNWSTVPSMLLELGYMTNPTEDRKLVTSEYQDKLVRGLVNGVCEYLGREIPYK